MAEANYWSEIERFTTQTSQVSFILTIIIIKFNSFFNFKIGWSTPKRRSDISWECIINIIHAAKGSDLEIKKYIKLIENIDTQLELATKFKITDVVIEVIHNPTFYFNLTSFYYQDLQTIKRSTIITQLYSRF
jgi:hypothetical protein